MFHLKIKLEDFKKSREASKIHQILLVPKTNRQLHSFCNHPVPHQIFSEESSWCNKSTKESVLELLLSTEQKLSK